MRTAETETCFYPDGVDFFRDICKENHEPRRWCGTETSCSGGHMAPEGRAEAAGN